MSFLRWLCLGFLGASALSLGQVTPQEHKGLEDSLFIGNLKLEDLKFGRNPFKDATRMPLIDKSLDDPLSAADDFLILHRSVCEGKASRILETAIRTGFPEVKPLSSFGSATPPVVTAKIPISLKSTVETLVSAMQSCDSVIKKSLEKLSPEEQRELIEGLPGWAVEEPKVIFDFVKLKQPSQSRILELVRRVDLNGILSASASLTESAEKAMSELQSKGADVADPLFLTVKGVPILICGKGSDVHDETNARLTIDLGGDDTYRGRHGAGVGYSSVLLDLGGSDRYDVKDLSVGAGVLGIGIAIDGGGSDDFRGRSLCFGAGLCGVGIFEKAGGHDSYRSVSLAQGFGEFGIGLCLDTAGDDVYNVKLFGQGAARTRGVGWLVDRTGNDQYRAGGLSMNSPLFTGVSYSFSQGFASGYRDDTGGVSGGIGLLSDCQGDDTYSGDTYLQAASYWYSVGSLWDQSGNDTYSGYHYCQASAMHCCAAFLFDLSGDDSYVAKVGASLAIGHDYGVALLLDRAGNDIYAARDSTPGVGVANGLGVFLDSDGTDRYDGPPGQGSQARGTGSLGIFVDLGGQDKYRAGLADSQGTRSSTWGTAFDAEALPDSGTEPPNQHSPPRVGSVPKPSDIELEAIYKLATQWGVGSAQAAVQENVDKLIGIGAPAFEWMLNNHLAKADRLQIRTFVAVAKALGPEAGVGIGPKALGGSKAEKRILIQIAMDAGILDMGAILAPLLDDPELQDIAARAAGPLKAVGCEDGLYRLCRSEDKLLARTAMVSLSQIGSVGTVGTAQAMLKSSDFLTREAAIALILKYPEKASEIGEVMLNDPEESRVRYGLRFLGSANAVANLQKIASMLLDPRPGVRMEAMLQLDGRCPQEYRQAFLSLQKDPVAVVRAVARRVKASA